MKFYVSYFYKIRFFPKSLVPVSTAVWDPKWYHDFSGNDYVFRDKRDVVNGLRIPILNSSKIYADECCCNDTVGWKYDGSGEYCDFMNKYYEYLKTLPFDKVIENLKTVNKMVPDADVCLMVHEPTHKPCGERRPLVKWFEENGVELVEWKEG